MTDHIILETEDLTKEFAGFVAVNGVNLRVARGTIHALIGPNGAGKTTLVNLITGITPPTRGTIAFDGRRLNGLRPHQIGRMGVARTFQVVRPFAKWVVASPGRAPGHGWDYRALARALVEKTDAQRWPAPPPTASWRARA